MTTQPSYPIIPPSGAEHPENLRFFISAANIFLCGWWLFFCASKLHEYMQLQMFILLVVFVAGMGESTKQFARAEFSAKGLHIVRGKDETGKFITWNKLSQIEIRNRGLNLFPNYVCFKYASGKDDLLLLSDILKDMDVTSLVEKVKTWAPNATIKGDTELRKQESIASYTELWLKDLSTETRRISQNQRLTPGAVLNDRYSIVKILSGGGQGTAYLAKPTEMAPSNLPSNIVLKEFILPENSRGLARAKQHLANEAVLMQRIQHPGIVGLFDSFIEDLRGYLVVEYVNGMTLKELVFRQGIPSEQVIVKFGSQLCDALIYLHALKPPIVHSDVSPDNVMVTPEGNVKLLDFDAAQELTKGKVQTVMGKHSYMAPEQFRGEPGLKSDMYSLGGTLHFLLTGSDPEPISQSIPAAIRPSVSEAMSKLVAKATAADESARFANVIELKNALERM